jgi:hypothetical protein
MRMTARELFIVGIRLIGIAIAIENLPSVLQLNYLGAAPAVAGLALFARADVIARLCYPLEARKDRPAERMGGDFRDI